MKLIEGLQKDCECLGYTRWKVEVGTFVSILTHLNELYRHLGFQVLQVQAGRLLYCTSRVFRGYPFPILALHSLVPGPWLQTLIRIPSLAIMQGYLECSGKWSHDVYPISTGLVPQLPGTDAPGTFHLTIVWDYSTKKVSSLVIVLRQLWHAGLRVSLLSRAARVRMTGPLRAFS